jgi:hypothetical protein
VLAFFSFMASCKSKIHQRVQGHIGHGVDVSSTTAVAPIGATKFFVLLMPKRHATISPVASANVYQGFINEFHGCLF